VDDLGKNRIQPQGLLPLEMLLHMLCELGIGVAEAPQETGARASPRDLQEEAELATIDSILRGRCQPGEHLQGVWKRRKVRRGELFQVVRLEHNLSGASAQRLTELLQQDLVTPLPLPWRGNRRQRIQAVQQRLAAGLRRSAEANADFLVQGLDQWHLRLLIALEKPFPKRPERLVLLPGGGDAPEDP